MDIVTRRAQEKAELSLAAAKDIDQAGRALAVVMEHCKSNTVDVKTVQILNVAVAYINSAMGGVLDHVAGDQIEESIDPKKAIIL